MSSEKTGNPVLLWGDQGPDVYKLSQIYDPRNDKYVLTQDTTVAESKDYYERLSLILTTDENVQTGRKYYARQVDSSGTVKFVEVINVTGANPKKNGWYQDAGGKILVFSKIDLTKYTNPNPYLLGWYEANASAVDMCGKIIPALYSVVVVDDVDCAYKREGNYKTRMMLSVESVDAAFNVTFAPFTFGTDVEETVRAIDYGNERFMLYFDRKGENENIVLTPDRKLLLYGTSTFGYRLIRSGMIVSTNMPAIQKVESDGFIPYARANAQRVVVTAENYETFRATGASIPYLDIVLDNGLQRTVQLPELNAHVPTCDATFKASRIYYNEAGNVLVNTKVDNTLVGHSIAEYAKANNIETVYSAAGDDNNTVDIAYDGTYIGRTAYKHDEQDAIVANVYVPEKCYLKSGLSIVDGEVLTLEVYEFNAVNAARLCMSVSVIAKEGTALDATDVTTRQIVSFDIDLNGSSTIGDIWYLQQGDSWRNAFDVTARIGFDDGSYMLVPIDNKTCYAYGLDDIKSTVVGREYQILFKFFPHKTLNVNWQKVGLKVPTDYLTVRKTVKIINNLSETVRKVSLIPAWNHNKFAYELFYLVYKNDFMSPELIKSGLDTKYNVVVYKETTDTIVSAAKSYYYKTNSGQFFKLNLVSGTAISRAIDIYGSIYEAFSDPATTIMDVSYIGDDDNVMYIGAEASGGTFDVVQRATIAIKIHTDGVNATDVYKQKVAFKLQPMNLQNEDAAAKWLIADDEKLILDTTKIPFGGGAYRPYIVYDPANASFRVDRSMFSFKQFVESFWDYANPPVGSSSEDTSGVDSITPSHFFFRGVDNEAVASPFIPMTDEADDDAGENFTKAVTMEGCGSASENIGGAIPVRIRDAQYDQGTIELHGTVIVEFVKQYIDPLNPSRFVYKHLYAVPVEVKLAASAV